MAIKVCLDAGRRYEPGEPPPEGYMAWQDWAHDQYQAGLRQSLSQRCRRYKFPQELAREGVCKQCAD
jgi:hypothetical protein